MALMQDTNDSGTDALNAGSSLFMAFVIHKAGAKTRCPCDFGLLRASAELRS